MAGSYRLELLVDAAARPLYEEAYGAWQTRDYPENAGVDLFVSENTDVAGKPILLDQGVRARMIDTTTGLDVHYWLVPRSSIFKAGIIMANSVGVIDRGYRGPIKAPVITSDWSYGAPQTKHIERGQRLFQILAPNMGSITEVALVDQLPESQRGSGGFGSTGR